MISPVCGWMTIFIASSQRTSRVAGAGLLREAPETSGGPIEAPGFGPLPSPSPPRAGTTAATPKAQERKAARTTGVCRNRATSIVESRAVPAAASAMGEKLPLNSLGGEGSCRSNVLPGSLGEARRDRRLQDGPLIGNARPAAGFSADLTMATRLSVEMGFLTISGARR